MAPLLSCGYAITVYITVQSIYQLHVPVCREGQQLCDMTFCTCTGSKSGSLVHVVGN